MGRIGARTEAIEGGRSAGPSRRAVLAGAGGAAALAGLGALLPRGAAPRAAASPALRAGGRAVAVLGGGVAGLTAAHELAERGFEVTVYEPTALGGKARSIPVPGTGAGGRADLPGEHGFRFFPGFYQHIPETMARIPVGAGSVADNLVGASTARLSLSGAPDLTAPMTFTPGRRLDFLTPHTLRESLGAMLDVGGAIPPDEVAWFLDRLVVFLTSSIDRRFGEWEYIPWEKTLRAADKSPMFREVLVSALTRQLVAAKPSVSSTRTIGTIGQAFVLNIAGIVPAYGTHADRLLCAPTNEAWIDPWVAHLRSLGVRFAMGTRITGLETGGGRVTAARAVDAAGVRRPVTADWYVAAMPVEQVTKVLTPGILDADPALAGLRELVVDWMAGIQFFLRTPTPITPGHMAYMGTSWALTSISQAQFWRRDIPADYGDGTVADCLSVDISDWDTPGILYGRPAKRCSREEIAREVWAQMRACLDDTGEAVLRDEDLAAWSLDPGIHWDPAAGAHANDTPLLVNTVGSWDHRPQARTAVPNLFLAGDYVRTDIDLATMEGADESARAAVDALLDAADSPAARCPMFRLHEPPELQPMRDLDAQRYRAGLPHILDR